MTIRHLTLTAVVLGVGLAAASCGVVRFASTPVPRLCPDHRPPQLILHAECRDGICGYTCAPDRWPPEPITARPIRK